MQEEYSKRYKKESVKAQHLYSFVNTMGIEI
jgi:hypothetical protein